MNDKNEKPKMLFNPKNFLKGIFKSGIKKSLDVRYKFYSHYSGRGSLGFCFYLLPKIQFMYIYSSVGDKIETKDHTLIIKEEMNYFIEICFLTFNMNIIAYKYF